MSCNLALRVLRQKTLENERRIRRHGAGYSGASYVSWYGIYVPAGTPDAIAAKINDGINKALLNPDVQKQLSIADIPGKPMSLSELAALMKADHDKLTTVVTKLRDMSPLYELAKEGVDLSTMVWQTEGH